MEGRAPHASKEYLHPKESNDLLIAPNTLRTVKQDIPSSRCLCGESCGQFTKAVPLRSTITRKPSSKLGLMRYGNTYPLRYHHGQNRIKSAGPGGGPGSYLEDLNWVKQTIELYMGGG